MSIYFRKSVKAGPLRLTFSKSGVSVSAGVKGARITSGPRGTYVTVGAGGLTYRQRIDRLAPVRAPGSGSPVPIQPVALTYDPTDPFAIKTAEVSELKDATNAQVIAALNDRARSPAYAPWVLVVTGLLFIFMLGTLPVLAWVIALAGCTAGYFVAQGDRENRTTPLYYDLAEDPARTYSTVSGLVKEVGASQRLWRVQTRQAINDWKRNAGASHLLNRLTVRAGPVTPPFIRTNVEVMGVNAGTTQLFFFPDHLLVRQQGQYGAVDYRTLEITSNPTSFIQDGTVPRDAQVLHHTWQYVNKNGGPDRRFKNNRKLPVMRYAEVRISSRVG
ncbi:DUF4236 domain-containing protein [Deinococcus oregonensis]|uniref:DUF4236 domain-containing protein n=1 Tax=Deinococcus oregonensis TaxID=1805970 RepID=A0ABV6AWL2_9DEIO